MYLHKTFNLAKYWGVTHRVQESVNQKPLRVSQKLNFGLISDYIKNRHTCDALACNASLVKSLYKLGHI